MTRIFKILYFYVVYIFNFFPIVGFEVFTAMVIKTIIFWDITPCSPLSVNLLVCWFLAEIISSTLKMEAACSSETLVHTQRTTRHYIPEDDTLPSLLLL
jgi:hypothetical protein